MMFLRLVGASLVGALFTVKKDPKIMQKLLLLLLTFALLASPAWSQSKSKSKTGKKSKAETVKLVEPKLTSKIPKFQGFDGSFITFGSVEGKSRGFSMRIEFAPWFFEVEGSVDAGVNTEDLDILGEDLLAVLAYYDATGTTKAKDTYQSAPFDFMLYVNMDNNLEPTVIKNLNINLVGDPAALPAAVKVLKQAKTWSLAPGKAFTLPSSSDAVFEAQADPLYKSDLQVLAEQAQKVKDSIAAAEKRTQDSIAAYEQFKADSIKEAKAQAKKAKAAKSKKSKKKKK
jgi:hypothetical protein